MKRSTPTSLSAFLERWRQHIVTLRRPHHEDFSPVFPGGRKLLRYYLIEVLATTYNAGLQWHYHKRMGAAAFMAQGGSLRGALNWARWHTPQQARHYSAHTPTWSLPPTLHLPLPERPRAGGAYTNVKLPTAELWPKQAFKDIPRPSPPPPPHMSKSPGPPRPNVQKSTTRTKSGTAQNTGMRIHRSYTLPLDIEQHRHRPPQNPPQPTRHPHTPPPHPHHHRRPPTIARQPQRHHATRHTGSPHVHQHKTTHITTTHMYTSPVRPWTRTTQEQGTNPRLRPPPPKPSPQTPPPTQDHHNIPPPPPRT